IINLKRSPERMARMNALLSGMGLNFVRVEAVDGKQFTPDTIETLCIPKPDGIPWTAQEIAVTLSHRECWKKAASSPEEFSIILEDDLFFSDDSAYFFTERSWLPSNFDLVKLETVGRKVLTDKIGHTVKGRQVVRLHSYHFGSGAYIISREFANNLLRLPEKVANQSDTILFSK